MMERPTFGTVSGADLLPQSSGRVASQRGDLFRRLRADDDDGWQILRKSLGTANVGTRPFGMHCLLGATRPFIEPKVAFLHALISVQQRLRIRISWMRKESLSPMEYITMRPVLALPVAMLFILSLVVANEPTRVEASSATQTTTDLLPQVKRQTFVEWQQQKDLVEVKVSNPLGHQPMMSSQGSIGGPTQSCDVDCGDGTIMTCTGDSCWAAAGMCQVIDDGEIYFWTC